MTKYKSVILIGPQGSGKGTQAQFLIPKLGANYLEAGAQLRQVAKQDNELGRTIKSLINTGKLISDDIWQTVVKSNLESFSREQPVILDGSPRTIFQAKILMDYLNASGRIPVATLNIMLPRHESIRRLQNRKVCEDCQKPSIFSGNLAEACAKCEGKLVVRHDDQDIDAINHRLDLYETETKPVLDYLKQQTDFFEIDGMGSIEEVADQIWRALALN